MGDILDKAGQAVNGTPYTGSVANTTQGAEKSSPQILKHSAEGQQLLTRSMNLNESANVDD